MYNPLTKSKFHCLVKMNSLCFTENQLFHMFFFRFLLKFFVIVSYEFYSSYEIKTENCFCVCHKNKEKHIQHFKLLFFIITFTIWYIKLSRHRKTNLLLKNSINLVLSTFEIQRRLIQTKYTTSFFTLSEKK